MVPTTTTPNLFVGEWENENGDKIVIDETGLITITINDEVITTTVTFTQVPGQIENIPAIIFEDPKGELLVAQIEEVIDHKGQDLSKFDELSIKVKIK